MKIGVFDSGIGGQAVASRLQELIPDAEIILADDRSHVPYGTRPDQEITDLTDKAIQPLLSAKCDAIVIACNTATAVAIETLRERYSDMNFVGIEPMVKPAAAQSQTKRIAVFATPATLRSKRYAQLKARWASDITVGEPDCSSWAQMIETGQGDDVPIEQAVEDSLAKGADVIVLACTHYHLLKDRAEGTAAGRAVVLEPSDAIGQRVLTLLNESTN
jgi:glutamate racemase